MKTCTKCKIEKPKLEYYKRSGSADGLYAHCKDCYKKDVSDYRLKNKELISERKSERYRQNKDKIRQAHAKRYAKYRERIRAQQADYKLRNPDKYTEKDRNRRARLKGAEGKHTAADVRAIFEGQRGLCAGCKSKLFKSGANRFHVDHIVPLVRGGSNWPSNLQCLCPPCNLSKGAKLPEEWAAQRGMLI